MQTFLTTRPESWQYILGVFSDFIGGDKDPATFQRADLKAYAAHPSKLRPTNKKCLAPCTQKNYLNHLRTFLRGTGRVVIVVTQDFPKPVRVVGTKERITKKHYRRGKLQAETTPSQWVWIDTPNPQVFSPRLVWQLGHSRSKQENNGWRDLAKNWP